jgi:hypothetical protein
MTKPKSRQRRWPATAVEAWRTFWFRPQPAYTLGLVRMAFGAVAIGWTVSLLPDLYALFGPHGVAPQQPQDAYQWGVFAIWTSDHALLIGWIVLLVSSVALTIGWHSRLASLAVFVLILSFEHRDPWVFNTGDLAVRIEAFFFALFPCGAALSVDQLHSTGQFWSAQQRPRWPVRLMQVELSLIYLASVQAKLNGNAWPQGTAVSYALRLQDMLLLPLPHWLTTSALLMNAATWATLAVELSIGILVWVKRFRPWVLAVGVIMHSLIMLCFTVGFFTFAMFVLYAAFIPPDVVERFPQSARGFSAKLSAALRRGKPRNGKQSEDVQLPGQEEAPTPPSGENAGRLTAQGEGGH